MTYYENNHREIITKAVCGTGKQFIHSTDYVKAREQPTSILGCWVINHKYRAKKVTADVVEVTGTYDINIWYAYHDNAKTDVVREEITYCDEVKLVEQDMHCLHDENEVVVKVIQQPNCLECKIDEENGKIAVEVEKEFIVQVIGETKINVIVDPRHQHSSFYQDNPHDSIRK